MMAQFAVPFLLCVLALGLLVAEDLLPTGGALALLSACCLGLLLYLGFSESRAAGFRSLAIEAVVIPAGFAAWAFVMGRTGLGRAAYLRPPDADEVVEVPGDRRPLAGLVGLRGVASTPLRPSGLVDFEGRRVDVEAESGFISPGAEVEAVRVRSGRLVVRPWPGGSVSGEV